MRRRGVALAVTLMALGLMTLFVVLAFMAAGMTHSVAQRYLKSLVAEQAARAGLGLALQAVQLDHDYHHDLSGTLASSGGTYAVTFLTSEPPWSTNNIDGAALLTGYQGRAVPAGCCHLIGRGTYQNVVRQAEAMLKVGTSGNLQILARWGD